MCIHLTRFWTTLIHMPTHIHILQSFSYKTLIWWTTYVPSSCYILNLYNIGRTNLILMVHNITQMVHNVTLSSPLQHSEGTLQHYRLDIVLHNKQQSKIGVCMKIFKSPALFKTTRLPEWECMLAWTPGMLTGCWWQPLGSRWFHSGFW